MTIAELQAVLAKYDPGETICVYDGGPGGGGFEISDVQIEDESLYQIEGEKFGTYGKRRVVLIIPSGFS